jgi:hypothetical protein
MVDAVDVLRDRVEERTSEIAVLKVEASVAVDIDDVGRAALEIGRRPVEELTFRSVEV